MTDGLSARVHREVLDNGLTVLVDHDPGAAAVAIVTHVRAGFFDEPDELAGISHVLEHMFFKGTPRHGAGELARRTKAAGGWLNAGTGYDHTSYYTVLPAGSFEEGLSLQADALRHAAIEADELGRELQVIIEEARRKRDTPSAVAHESMHALLFDHHRIRRWRIGEEERLAGFTREAVAGYYATRYTPARTILAVAGGVAPAEVTAAARRHLGDWTAAVTEIPRGPEEPWRHDVRARTLRGDVSQADLVLGWRTVPPLHADAPALDAAAAVLSAGRSAWLPQRLRDPGIVLSVLASHFTPTEVGVFSVNADLDPARLREALAGIAGALHRLGTAGPAPEDLDRARTLLRARLARRLESAESRAMLFAEAEALRDVHLVDDWLADLSALTPADVREAARRWLRPDALAGVAYLPETGGEELTEAVLRESFAPPTPVPARRAPGTRVLALPGADLVVRAKPGTPLVTVGIFRRRRTQEPAAQAGLGALLVRTALRGAGGLDAAALATAFDRLGGPAAGSISADHFGFRATVLAEHLRPAADLLRRVMWEPHLLADRVAVERDTLAREALQLTDDMYRYPFQLALAAAFGDEGYGVPTGGTPGSVPTLTEADLRRWHQEETAAGRSLVVAVGDLDPESALAELAEVMAGAGADGGAEPPVSGPPALPSGGEQRIVTRARAQTAIAMVFPGPARPDSRRFAAELWASAAGGLGGRLFEALRGRRSLAYTVTASAWQRLGAGALLTYIATSPEREEEAREQMLAELDRFRAEGVTAGELEQAMGYRCGQAAVQRQTGAAILSELADLWLAGDPLEAFEAPDAPYRAVTREAIHELVAGSLDAVRRAEGVVRGGAGSA